MSSLPRIVGLMALSFAALSLVACGSGKKTDAESTPIAEPVAILAAQHGQASPVKFPSLKHISSQEQFDALGLEAKPAVFATEDMILVALGEQTTGGHWVRITGLQQVGDTVYVQATVNRPGEDAAATQAMTQPYCLVTTPKLGDVTLNSDITSVAGEEPPAE